MQKIRSSTQLLIDKDLDANGNKIKNVAAATAPDEVVNLAQMEEAIGAGSSGEGTLHINHANEIHTISEKSVIADTDEAIIEDSQTSPTPFEKKKVSFLSIWNYIKAKSDIIYSSIENIINFDANIEPTQTGTISKTVAWMLQYLTQGVKWVRAVYALKNDLEKPRGFGYLYNWYAVADGRGFVNNWRVPTDNDFRILLELANGGVGNPYGGGIDYITAGGKLKYSRDNYYDPVFGWYNTGTTKNNYNFSLLAAGYRVGSGFSQKNIETGYWISTEYNASYAYYVHLYMSNRNAWRQWYTKWYGLAVRLVMIDTSSWYEGMQVLIDGKYYDTVKIGTQVWLAHNLAATHYANGDEIPNIKTNAEWNALTSGAYCAYNNDETYVWVEADKNKSNINHLHPGIYEPVLGFTPEQTGVAATLITNLKDGVATDGDTLQKLYNLILGSFTEIVVDDIAVRDACNITHIPTNVFVKDDGDGNWALYKATSTGVRANFIKLSDPDLLNAVMSASSIKASYESNPDTNAFTNALLARLISIEENAVSLYTVKMDNDIAAAILSRHEPHSDDQDLSGLQPKEAGKGLSANDLTNILKSNYNYAYNHAFSSHAPTDAQKNSDITLDEITAKLKRLPKRTATITSSATPAINTDEVDMYLITEQAEAITSFTTNLIGTPVQGQILWIAITGTATRAISWGTSFEASTVALPTTTVTTARLDVGFVWNTVTNKWRCIAIA
ncbi:MAG: hypothetical protein NTZ33_06445 [Bacteroidetes bacterium]|nr:hypothetical protein [Bacteroidota bacterium]